ncbi:cytochrome P450 [Polyplosphaeria fusca]|uniref:Cytochrome P450 n=1 Tax=Polyplosphaeria fusca TaxID=682080 RepID=A0A9P4R0M4_9PLEO|nr:cytochrome P450 [Polyplosphaeria fusca]
MCVLYATLIFPFYRSNLRHLPTPPGNFLLGHTLSFVLASSANALPLRFMRSALDAPLIRILHAFGSEWVLVNGVEATREIWQSNVRAFKRPDFFKKAIVEIAGVGMVGLEGEAHRVERRAFAVPFSLGGIKKLVPLFNAKAAQLSSRIKTLVRRSNGEPIDAHGIFTKTALEVVGLATLGVEVDSLSIGGYTFADLYHRILDPPPLGQIIFAINLFIPIRHWLPLQENRKFVQANQCLSIMLQRVISERKHEICALSRNAGVEDNSQTKDDRTDFLSFMIRENQWSEEEILGHLLSFMSAGHDTSALALTWATLTLCLHPSMQSRLRAEIQANLPANGRPSYTNLESLPFLNAFIKEVLRCFAPITFNPRTPINDTFVCGTLIPAGTPLLLSPQVLNFNPTIWGPDAETFDPERWMPGDERADMFPLSRDPFAMASFGYGPRICIGKAFAVAEIKSVIVEMVSKFEVVRGWDERGKKMMGRDLVKSVGDEDVFGGVEVKNFMTLKPKEGVWVNFRALDD